MGRAKAKAASRIVSDARIEDMIRIRLDGAMIWDALAYVRSQEGVKESPWFVPDGEKALADVSVRKYVEWADREIYRSKEKNKEKMFARHVAQRRNLFARAVTTGDLGNARQLLKDEAEMLDLYPAKKLKVIVGDEDIDAAIERELARLATGGSLEAVPEIASAESASESDPATTESGSDPADDIA